MSDNKRTGGMGGKGYYIALILCAAAIGVMGFLYYRNANEAEPVLQTEEPVQTISPVSGTEYVPVIAPEASEEVSATLGTEEAVNTTLQTTWPVSGVEVYGYSMETLSYNETTRDWRVHDGLDIAADAGTEVVAAADGEVYTIYEDDTMGVTVVIRHTGGYTTKYSSLSEVLSVSVGDKVSMGQVIGTVGDTALVETVLGPHVHFSVTYQDAQMDPAEFLNMD